MIDARIIVLNFNGQSILPLCLPSILEAAQTAQISAPVTVLDNLSSDASEDLIRRDFPEIHFVKAEKNLVLCSYNSYVANISESVVILLNNDIRVDKFFIAPLTNQFHKDPDTFLVAPRVMSFDGKRIDAARTKAGMKLGSFYANARYPGYETEALRPSDTFSSGFGAFSREKFLRLGGYDHRYLPGIMEDADLCLRARRAGFTLYYEPASIVYHMGQASFKKAFGGKKLKILGHRNNFLFMWKNFTGLRFWITHLLWLPIRLLASLLKGDSTLACGLIEALRVNIKK